MISWHANHTKAPHGQSDEIVLIGLALKFVNCKLAIFYLFPKCTYENNSCTCEKVSGYRFIHGMVRLENKDTTACVFSRKYSDAHELINISCVLAFVRKTDALTRVQVCKRKVGIGLKVFVKISNAFDSFQLNLVKCDVHFVHQNFYKSQFCIVIIKPRAMFSKW